MSRVGDSSKRSGTTKTTNHRDNAASPNRRFKNAAVELIDATDSAIQFSSALHPEKNVLFCHPPQLPLSLVLLALQTILPTLIYEQYTLQGGNVKIAVGTKMFEYYPARKIHDLRFDVCGESDEIQL